VSISETNEGEKERGERRMANCSAACLSAGNRANQQSKGDPKMATNITTLAPTIANLAATVSGPDVTEKVNYLMALSEALWEKASQQAGPEVTALFSAHIEMEALIRWLESSQQASWPNGEIARGDVEKSIGDALALFGEDLDEALEPHLQEVGLRG